MMMSMWTLVRVTLPILALFFGMMTLAANLLPTQPRPVAPQGEMFDPGLAEIDTLDKAEVWIRNSIETPDPSDAETADAIARFMRLRFFHDVAYFSLSDNWLAWLAGFVRSELATPVRPDDLLKYRRGICSQQALVFQALLDRFGLDYATIGFDAPPHMLVGAKIDGVWALYDSDKEPRRNRVIPYSEVLKGEVLVELYGGKPGTPKYGFNNDVGLQWRQAVREGKVEIKDFNTYPAARGAAFHALTEVFSRFGWVAFSLLAALAWTPLPRQPRVQKLPGRAQRKFGRAIPIG